jgi:hypothetical protein
MAARFAEQLTDDARRELAVSLRLPVEVLGEIPHLGWWPDHKTGETLAPCWTVPEVDSTGGVVGIGRRFREPVSINGGKPTNKASLGPRGLVVPSGWKERPGPLLTVEGASDVLALAAAGVAAIGRPSNESGAELLAGLLADLPAARTVIVLAENDGPKPDGSWPGKTGADKVAGVLAAKLGRSVPVAFPPAGAKDAREWVCDLAAGQAEVEDWPAIGRAILEHVERTAQGSSRFKFIDSTEFLAGDYRLEFLVPRILAKGQPAVIGGPHKTLKTSILIDLAVSMATATPFLGAFPVRRRTRVAIASGESGEFVLKETCLRILAARGLDATALSGWLKWEFTLPTLSDAGVMADFGDRLAELRVEAAIIDPLYLSLGNVDAKSVFEMGRALRPVAERLLKHGVTPILSHHSNRTLPAGEVMGLEHLSHAGLAEFARQWLLLNRREKYKGNGVHDLWVNVGGSAGHGGMWTIRVGEGIADEHCRGRRWEVAVETASEATASAAEEREAQRRQDARKKMLDEEAAVLEAIDAEVSTGQPAATITRIRSRCPQFSNQKIRDILDRLIDSGAVEEVEFEKKSGNGARKNEAGYRRSVR